MASVTPEIAVAAVVVFGLEEGLVVWGEVGIQGSGKEAFLEGEQASPGAEEASPATEGKAYR